jgi:hypothetical protein
LRVAFDDAGDGVGEVGVGIDAGELGCLCQGGDDGLMPVAPSEPAKSAFLRLRSMGRIARSTTLLSISMRPSSRKRARAGPAGERVADLLGELALLAVAHKADSIPMLC